MFEVTGNHISSLRDDDLRTLVTRLSLAELGCLGQPLSSVTAGGDQNAADGGIDVRISRPKGSTRVDFIPRDVVGIQVKVSDMAAAAITAEMCPGGTLRSCICDLAEQGGAYLIVSANGSVSDSALTRRRKAMRDAVSSHPHAAALHTDFYDRERIANWVRQYPGVSAWVLERLGLARTGWQSFGNWSEGGATSKPYLVDDDGCIIDERTHLQERLPIVEGISRLRHSLSQPGKCVRLIGLSGLGKTRLVEALFESSVGNAPLQQALAVYTDNADEPDPSARDMARHLVRSKQRAILIVDNCNPATHAALAQICSVPGSAVSLITVEYDVRDDDPEGTDVFRLMKASGSVIEQWLEQSCPHVSQFDRRRIASFSEGNFRVAKALAHTIKKGETLGTLNDQNLFERIFNQRSSSGQGLMVAAEICSLVYSFDGQDTGANGELAALAALAGQSVDLLYDHIAELKKRGILQTRSKWRAILPHAIANRLADLALNRIAPERLHQFSSHLSSRLLKSLSRRLGYLHQNQNAHSIAIRWLSPQGLICDLSKLDDDGIETLRNIAPVDPDAVLTLIEKSVTGTDREAILSVSNRSRWYWINLLKALAYEPHAFTLAANLLSQFLASEPNDYNFNSAQGPFRELFQLMLSGTRATPDRRRALVRQLLLSHRPEARKCGFIALDAMLNTGPFSAMSMIDFGARPRDYGWRPATSADVSAWYQDCIKMVAELLTDETIAPRLQSCLAYNFRTLWQFEACRNSIEEAATIIVARKNWTDGWIAVRKVLHFDSHDMTEASLNRLKALEMKLKPSDFIDMARVYIFSPPGELLYADDEDGEDSPGGEYSRAMRRTEAYGAEIATMPEALSALLDEAVIAQTGRISQFGSGLAIGTPDIASMWAQIMAALERHPLQQRRVDIVGGFLSGLAKREAPELDEFLDSAITDQTLGPCFPWLQATAGLNELGIERLHKSLDARIGEAWSYGTLSIGGVAQSVPGALLAPLLRRIASLPSGHNIALDILQMRCFGDRQDGVEIDAALIECSQWMLENLELVHGENKDHVLGEIASACLAGPAAEQVTRRVCSRIRSISEDRYFYASEYPNLIKALFAIQPNAALDGFFASADCSDSFGNLLDFGFSRWSPLEAVNLETLGQWAMSAPEVRFPNLANSIRLFLQKGDNIEEWSPTFLRLLELAPDKEQFLTKVRNRLRPSGWSGSLAGILDRRRALMAELVEHPNAAVRTWAIEQERRLEAEANNQRVLERREDESFE